MLAATSVFKTLCEISRTVYVEGTICGRSRGGRVLKISDTRLCSNINSNVALEMREREVDESLQKETDFNKILQILGNGDEEVIQLLKRMQWSYHLCKESGGRVPSVMTLQNYKKGLELDSKGWPFHFEYLYQKEEEKERKLVTTKKRNEQNMKVRADFLKRKSEFHGGGDPNYGVWGNCIVRSHHPIYMRHILNANLIPTHQFGQKLILDFSYESVMASNTIINTCNQVTMVLGSNRFHINPFHIIMCNFKKDNYMEKQLSLAIPTLYDKDCLLADFTEKSYLDIFPKEKLVYLSPHARDELDEVNSDDIYIIGVLNTKGNNYHHTMVTAKRHNLRSARLPFSKYVDWLRGSQSLNLSSLMNILLDQRHYKDWKRSFRHVPSRFVNPFYVNRDKEKLRNSFAV